MPISNLYGCSEIGAAFFDNPLSSEWEPGSIGKPFDVFQAAIFNEKDVVLPGITGEIGVTGSGLLKGYLNEQDTFKASMHHGYFMTGDLGYVDKEGLFHYVDRKKDLIIKGGINISLAKLMKHFKLTLLLKKQLLLEKPIPIMEKS